MTVSKERLANALLGLADLVERYPEITPLLERLERDYDAMSDAKSAVDRICSKLGLTDD